MQTPQIQTCLIVMEYFNIKFEMVKAKLSIFVF